MERLLIKIKHSNLDTNNKMRKRSKYYLKFMLSFLEEI